MAEQKLQAAYYNDGGLRFGPRSLAKLAAVKTAAAKDYLGRQEVAQLVLTPKRVAVHPRFDVTLPNIVHQIDLLHLPNDDGYDYALVVIDAGSRRVDIEPLKDKSATLALAAIKRIYARNRKDAEAKRKREFPPLGSPPEKLEIDSGSEFKGAFLAWFNQQKTFVRVGEPGRHRSQSLVEAANRTIGKALLRRQLAQEILTGQPSREWVADIPGLVASINRVADKRPKLKPIDEPIYRGLTGPIMQEGDRVRVALEVPRNLVNNQVLHGRFRAGDIRWSPKVYTIRTLSVVPGKPPMYWVNGFSQSFTTERLQPVKATEPPPPSVVRGAPGTYIVQELIGRRKVKGRVELQVLWYGYPRSQATWEPRTQLMEDVPAIVARDEPKLK